jgi:hypothetical protein
MKVVRLFPPALVVAFARKGLAIEAAISGTPAAAPFALAKMNKGGKRGFDALRVATTAIPRGGGILGTPVTTENLVATWIAYYSITGALLPAPKKAYDLYGWKPSPTIVPGSLLEFSSENCQAYCIGLSVMIYLSNFRSMDAATVVAYGSLACGYVLYKQLLNDVFSKIGCPKGTGTLLVAVLAGFFYAVFGGKTNVDTTLLANLICLPSAVLGVVGWFDPDAAKKLLGIKASYDTFGRVAFRWVFRFSVQWAFVAYSLLWGRDAKATAGWVALLYAVMGLDTWFITKEVAAVNVPPSTVVSALAVAALVGLGLLMN